MEITVILPALTRLTWILEMVCQAIAYRTGTHTNRGYGPFPLVPANLRALVWQRVRRAEARFKAFVARFYAGEIRPYTPRAKPAKTAAARKPSIPPIGPRKPGWLFGLLQHEAGAAASQLAHLFTDPEMRKLLAAHPQAVEILRPTCRMLNLERELRLAATPAPEPGSAQAAPAPTEPPPERTPGMVEQYNLRIVWRPQNHP